jgi:hypothetical protein
VAASPGVQWAQFFDSWNNRAIGLFNPETLAVIQDFRLLGVNLLDGSASESLPGKKAYNAMLDAARPVLYVCTSYGRIEAFGLPEQGGVAPGEPLWEIEFDAGGPPTLLPLPGGGLAVVVRGRMFGVSAQGRLLWEHEATVRPFAWALADEGLILATRGQDSLMWTLTQAGPLAWPEQINGRPVIVGDQAWVYNADGIYRLDLETLSAELLYALPQAILAWSDIVALPEGGVLVAHADAFDRRLIALHGDGTLRWQRSYARVIRGQQSLAALGERVYLLAQDETSSSSQVTLLAIDVDTARLTRIFTGGTRRPLSRDTWVFAVDNDHILLNVGGGHTVALDVAAALELISH